MTDVSDTPDPASRPGPRPGGRSARIQSAVHAAVRELQDDAGREGLTVPAIASRAGVTASTIYRRWGDLGRLLADVAVEQLWPETPPADEGSFEADLRAWLEQYVDEMTSVPGRAMLRDLLGTQDHAMAGKCLTFCTQQIDVIRERALDRGEHPVPTIDIIDGVIAPVMFRIVFANATPVPEDVDRWTRMALQPR
ncbi:TetR/AcrR family transcriptional regulator [Dyella sp. 333MFSha]|uniref:TetR/AcrR family transcriptional regulator n=1 Tax=Dyella sp. 333MFSha TaxID=1798240 RepID=UPI00088053DA|nr:TetR/AcrR family transcriptional regulator [Dyella sp. 333MFSha]SDF43938.1 DNA-binding transcriptional regulator, AcrR family [Dyella sp. 333MFSha]